MAITATALDTNSTGTASVGPWTTASITPAANQPVLLSVLLAVSSGNTPIPSVAGCGLSWQLLTQSATGARTVYLFLGIGASPTTDVVTISGDGATSVATVLWQVTQASGVATAVASGVVQTVNAKPASATSVSVPFGSTVTAGNATFAAVGVAANLSPTAGSGWTAQGATSNSGRASGLLAEFAGTAQQNVTASFASANNSFVAGVELAAAATGGTDATASGPVARVTVTALAGSVSTSGGTLRVDGPVAAVGVSAPAGSVSSITPQVAPSTTLTWPVPDWFKTAVRAGFALSYTVDAYLGGSKVAGAQGMAPVGGTITDTIRPGVRRSLNVDLPGDKALFDALAPTGTTLHVTAHVTLTSQQVVDVPMGAFVVDQVTLSEGGGKLSVTAPDRWSLIQRAKFIGPASSTPGIPVTQQIVLLIQRALGGTEPVTVTASSQALVGALTWQQDRDKAIQDLATSIGAWVYVDRYGVFTVADVPTLSASATWLVDASPSGVLVTLDRQKSRASTHNVVVVDSSSSSTPTWGPVYVWDSDPASPTYAGPDPVNHPEQAGPFGIAPYLYSDPNIGDAQSATFMARSILAKVVGIASQVNLTQLPNPAIDSFDSLDVLPPGRVYGRRPASGGLTPGAGVYPGANTYPGGSTPAVSWAYGPDVVLERHIADTVTHSLDASALQIQGRSTRTDPYT